jgi:hypothetical protein
MLWDCVFYSFSGRDRNQGKSIAVVAFHAADGPRHGGAPV